MERRAVLLDVAWYVGMGLFLLLFLSPTIWVYLAALTPSTLLAASPTAIFDVTHYSFAAFPRVWAGSGFGRSFLNSLAVGIVYLIGNIPLGVWMLRGFMDAIPRELDEAVLVDGGRFVDVLRHVIFPLAQPGIVTIGAFAFMTSWGEYLFALSLITSNQNWTLPLALQEAFSRNSVDLGALTAGGVLVSLPVAVLFMALQRTLVAGLTAGGVKG
jgi:ABC-type glycerol-3-phosphate transport system permease component